MEKEFNELEITKGQWGYFYRFRHEGLTSIQGGHFSSVWDCFEAAKRNDLISSSEKPIRILATSGIIQWLEEYGRLNGF